MMKPHWLENAVWQFIGVVVSAVGLFISVLPEGQRFLGTVIAIVGVCIFSWVLLKKPAKRLTQHLTHNHTPSSSYLIPTPDVKTRAVRISTDEEYHRIDKKYFGRTKKWWLSILIPIGCIAIVAFTAWEMYFLWRYIENIFPDPYTWNVNTTTESIIESSEYVKLRAAYQELYSYAQTSVFLLWFGLSFFNLWIVSILVNVLRSLPRKLKQIPNILR